MWKFVYVGDPAPDKKGKPSGPARDGECTFVNSHSSAKESVTFKVGVPQEAPDWIAARLKNHTHFKAVEDVTPAAAPPKAAPDKQDPPKK